MFDPFVVDPALLTAGLALEGEDVGGGRRQQCRRVAIPKSRNVLARNMGDNTRLNGSSGGLGDNRSYDRSVLDDLRHCGGGGTVGVLAYIRAIIYAGDT